MRTHTVVPVGSYLHARRADPLYTAFCSIRTHIVEPSSMRTHILVPIGLYLHARRADPLYTALPPQGSCDWADGTTFHLVRGHTYIWYEDKSIVV
jgi:hypothetical protein